VEWGTPWTFEEPVALDLADGANVTIALVSTTTKALCGKTYNATQTWSATDACGNSNTCSQTVTVVDTTPPTLTCAPSRTVEWGTDRKSDVQGKLDLADGGNVTIAIVATTTNALCGKT